VVKLAPELENLIGDCLRVAAGADHAIEPQLAQRIIAAIGDVSPDIAAVHGRHALVTTPAGRSLIARLLRPHFPDLAVLSFLEVPDDRQVEIVAVIGGLGVPANQPRLAQTTPVSIEEDERA
jgi:flagellar biosynthesis protein FlhA